MSVFWIIVVTALTSALCTLALAGLIYRLWLHNRLERRLNLLAETMEQRVRAGVNQAGEDLLPQFRRQVAGGFRDALADWPTEELRSATRAGADIVEEGLSTLLGRRRRDR